MNCVTDPKMLHMVETTLSRAQLSNQSTDTSSMTKSFLEERPLATPPGDDGKMLAWSGGPGKAETVGFE